MKTLTSELQANLILLLKDAWGHVDLCSAAQKALEVVEVCGLCSGNPGTPQNGCRGFEIRNQLKEKTLESKSYTDHRKGSVIQRQIYFLIKSRFFPLILSKTWFYKLMPVPHKRGLNVTIKCFHTAVLPPPSSPDPEKASRQSHSSLKHRLLNNATFSGFQIVYFMTQQGVVL